MAGPDKDLEKPWQKERRMVQHDINKGSKYPPFSIEHMPRERQRLAGAGMTDADRALRRQWLKDQELSPHEPREIPELKPRNIVKRIYGKPWDIFFGALRPIVGNYGAAAGRFLVPKTLMFLGGIWAFYYHLKYNAKTWEKNESWDIITNRDEMLYDQRLPPKAHDDFVDRGFKSRTALRDLKTSAA